MNKIKFESAVLDQIHEHVLSRTNVLQYIELATAAPGRKHEPSAEESAARAALADADAKLRRWEEGLERGLLSLEDAAERIRAVRQQRADVLKTQSRLERQSRSRSEIRTIPTPLMEAYIEAVRKRLREKAIFAKENFWPRSSRRYGSVTSRSP